MTAGAALSASGAGRPGRGLRRQGERHVVACCFAKLEPFRRIATRYEKTAASFLGCIDLAGALIWLR
ncbi:MAG TPA: hypothetical protein VFG43_00035 [Geminicoccaceae bacterium]|nr:hypothetical protein [Geminicoccaceae bacterium]